MSQVCRSSLSVLTVSCHLHAIGTAELSDSYNVRGSPLHIICRGSGGRHCTERSRAAGFS